MISSGSPTPATLSEAAYDRLVAHKRDDETFSDVVLPLAGEHSLLDLAGVLSDEDAEALLDTVIERRRRRTADLEATASRIDGS